MSLSFCVELYFIPFLYLSFCSVLHLPTGIVSRRMSSSSTDETKQKQEADALASQLAEPSTGKYTGLMSRSVQEIFQLLPFLPKEGVKKFKHILYRERYNPERDPALDKLVEDLKTTPEEEYTNRASSVVPLDIRRFREYMDTLPKDQIPLARDIFHKMKVKEPEGPKPHELRRSIDPTFLDNIFVVPNIKRAAKAFAEQPEARRQMWFNRMMDHLSDRQNKEEYTIAAKCIRDEFRAPPNFITFRPCDQLANMVEARRDAR